ncbi:MAG: hypothetical protein OEO83_13045 [Alphaproteobacteria bacterium]|nr:hypothetical protein [Alphaproteobacteria bacterium]
MHDDSHAMEPHEAESTILRAAFPRRIDAKVIAEELIREYGMDHAIKRATEGTFGAQKGGDNYQLSVWREVKVILNTRGREIGANAG